MPRLPADIPFTVIRVLPLETAMNTGNNKLGSAEHANRTGLTRLLSIVWKSRVVRLGAAALVLGCVPAVAAYKNAEDKKAEAIAAPDKAEGNEAKEELKEAPTVDLKTPAGECCG